MEIIFEGQHNTKEASESLLSIIQLLKDRYHIEHFREMHLSVTLLDDQGVDVELVDSETDEVFRVFEVCRQGAPVINRKGRPYLKLVVDNSAAQR